MNVDAIRGLIATAHRRPCVICGGPPVYVGVYIAEREAALRLGAPPGRTRLLPYSLCEQHPPSQDVAGQAEQLLEAFCAADPPIILTCDELEALS